MTIEIQRIYENNQSEGTRILVDRVWPRGISKEDANLDFLVKRASANYRIKKMVQSRSQIICCF